MEPEPAAARPSRAANPAMPGRPPACARAAGRRSSARARRSRLATSLPAETQLHPRTSLRTSGLLSRPSDGPRLTDPDRRTGTRRARLRTGGRILPRPAASCADVRRGDLRSTVLPPATSLPAAAETESGAIVRGDGTTPTACPAGFDPVGGPAPLQAFSTHASYAAVLRLHESMHAGEAAEPHGAAHGACQAGRTVRAGVAAPPRPEERTGPDPVARGHPVGRRRVGAVRRLKQPRGQGPWRTGPRPDAPSPPTEVQTSSCFTEPPSRPAGRRRPSASALQTVQIARDHDPNNGSGCLRSACGARVRRPFLGRRKCPAHRPQDGSDGRTPRAQPLVGSSTCHDYESFPSGRAGRFQPSIPFDP
jgi:hypothetical protein